MKQAVQWLKQNKGMLQKDIAEKMGITEVAFSNGMKRIQIKWDEDFVIKFQQSTGEIFSLDWLLNGTGDKFADKSKTQEPTPPSSVDFSSYINALLAKSDETIASLRRELSTKDDIIQEKDVRIKEKDERIADLEKLAEERLHRIAELRRYIDENNISMTDHPFPIGAADNTKQSHKRV
jgi:transcriptional regulator with XRE-family HTH domain